MRARAIMCALWFGVAPWPLYERRCHYAGGYLRHLRMNLQIAWRWATWSERHSDVDFHMEVNA